MIGAVLDHLWQSTLFLGGAGLVTLALRRNSAQIRFWLWFAASLKFLVPFAVLTALGALLLAPVAPPLAAPALHLMQPAAEPFSAPSPVLPTAILASGAPVRTGVNLSLLLLLAWAAGAMAILARWAGRWWRLRAILRGAQELPLAAPARVKLAPSNLEPGLVGIWRPVILLPQGIAERLSGAEMDAIMAHEICHFRRRDNLWAAIHMLVEALFWFYPPVWWLGARLNAERERACDESVLATGRAPQLYAESILKVCKLYLQSPLSCVSGVSGADLKKRVETIMANVLPFRLNGARKLLLGACAAAALVVPVVLGLVVAPPPVLAQATTADVSLTPELIAERGAEQALPRTAVAFDPTDFDKFVGYYQLGPVSVFTVHRDSGHFLARLTAQTDVEFFPESSTKFFATEVRAQISFDSDASGMVTDLVLHQNGLEQRAPRIDETAAKKIEADLDARVRAQKPSPGTEAALRFSLQSMEDGKPDLSNMTPSLAAIARTQLPASMLNIQSMGPIKSITFKNVIPSGVDVYDVAFANGAMEWRVMPLNADGKVSGMGGRRVP